MLRAVSDGDALARVTEFSFAALPHLLDAGPLGVIWQVAGHLGFEPLIATLAEKRRAIVLIADAASLSGAPAV